MFGLFSKKKTFRDPAEAIAAGEYETALDLYRDRLKKEPARAASWNKKIAELLVLTGRREEAVTAYLAAADAYERGDRALQAIALYKTVQRLDPGNPEILRRLGEIAAEKPEEAEPVQEGMTIRTRLRRYAPLFSEFDRDELTDILEVMDLHRAEPGQHVFRQGDPGDSLFILVQGEVVLTVDGSDGQPVVIDRLAEGACFGEVSALTCVPRTMTAMVTQTSEYLEIPRDYLEALSIAHPRVWKVLEDFQKNRQLPVGI